MITLEREVEMENGNKVRFIAGPRYPTWEVQFTSGQLPKKFVGARWTSFDQALADVKHYLENDRAARNRTTLKDGVKVKAEKAEKSEKVEKADNAE